VRAASQSASVPERWNNAAMDRPGLAEAGRESEGCLLKRARLSAK
jgi:hypothetical protein